MRGVREDMATTQFMEAYRGTWTKQASEQLSIIYLMAFDVDGSHSDASDDPNHLTTTQRLYLPREVALCVIASRGDRWTMHNANQMDAGIVYLLAVDGTTTSCCRFIRRNEFNFRAWLFGTIDQLHALCRFVVLFVIK